MTPQGAMVGFGRRPAKMLSAFSAGLMALATAACNPVADQYFREGAGSDLYTAQLPQETQLQDEYVYYICRQAGNPSVGGSCDGTTWTAFTLAGMNDIDRRCDAYLDWLDAQRRDRTPILAQIGAMGGSAVAIMGAAGAGVQALSIVANAFGLAGTTYANWNSRLLLDVDHSTVQTIVYTRQQDFRKVNVGVIVPDRPAAIYLLRGYLRICMPITIETTINTNVTLAQAGVSPTVIQNMFLRKAVFGRDAGPVSQPAPLKANDALRPREQPQAPAPADAQTKEEQSMTPAELSGYQARVLCLPRATGQFDAETRIAIGIFQDSFGMASPSGQIETPPSGKQGTRKRLIARSRNGVCPSDKVENSFEWQTFANTDNSFNQPWMTCLQKQLSKLNSSPEHITAQLDTETRAEIRTARSKLSEGQWRDVPLNANTDDQVTRRFLTELNSRAPVDGCPPSG
jgi:hypothetical protein